MAEAGAMTIADAEMRRLRWRCRRGLLENDLVLQRFLDRRGGDLDARRLAALDRLLAMDDTDLWDLVSGRAQCAEPGLQEMLTWLREA
jgi:antitoxin CptB